VQIDSSTRAIVTGASQGIGRAVARILAGRGARVGLVARGEEGLHQVASELGERASVHPADIADADSIEKAVADFVAEAGGLEIAVANAGLARYAPFADQDRADVERMVTVNVLGTMNTVRAALEPMLGSGRGHVVVVSSAAALRALPSGAVYGATKAANKNFAEAIRHELSGSGVSLSTVFPGEVKTAIHDRATQLPDWRDSEGAIEAEEVAEATVAAIEEDRREVHVPRVVRLMGLNGVAPGVVDRLLRVARGPSAAPRNY
jgi:short-subunit dehydrogenase